MTAATTTASFASSTAPAPARPAGPSAGFAGAPSAANAAAQQGHADAEAAREEELTEFLRQLKRIFEIDSIPRDIALLLADVRIDDTQNADNPNIIYAAVSEKTFTVTKNSVVATSPLNPALAYKMAATAALKYDSLSLSGTPEERALLFIAAQHHGIRIDNLADSPISSDLARKVATAFSIFEQENGLTNEFTSPYMATPDPAPRRRSPINPAPVHA